MRGDDIEPPVDKFRWYIEAFRELSTCRSAASLGPIPFTAIAEYCTIYKVEDFEDFAYFMRSMDDAYLRMKQDGGKN